MMLRFTWEEDIAPPNRGFTDHQLTAHNTAGEEVGYLKTCYIPMVRYKEFYPDIWHFLRQIRGWGFDLNNGDWGILDGIQHHMYTDWGDRRLNLPPREERTGPVPFPLQCVIKVAKMEAEERYAQDLIEHQAYHLDRPYVAFVRVHEQFRRQGIGTALHFEVNDRLSELGLRLHTACTMSDEMKLTLKAMVKRYPKRLRKQQIKGLKPKKYCHVFTI